MAVYRQGAGFDVNPPADTEIQVADELIVLGNPEQVKRLRELAAAG
jgi:Trk K+ transport system NAD-binding subunit